MDKFGTVAGGTSKYLCYYKSDRKIVYNQSYRRLNLLKILLCRFIPYIQY